MEFVEADPLPTQCQRCMEQHREEYNCEECDYLGLRFRLSEEDQRRLDRIMVERHSIRLISARLATESERRLYYDQNIYD